MMCEQSWGDAQIEMPKEAAWGPAQRTGDGERSDKLTGRDDSFAPGNRQGPRLSLSKDSQWG